MDKTKDKKPKDKTLKYPVSFPAEKTSKVESKEENTLKYPVPPVMEPYDPKPAGFARGGGVESRGKTRGRIV